MDANHETASAEVQEADERRRCSLKEEEAANCEKRLRLPAFEDETLSIEAAEQLVQMSEDPTLPAAEGADLPKADKKALLKKASQLTN